MPITTAFFGSELADSTCDNSVARGVWGDSAAPAVRFRACWLDPELELALLAAVDIIGTPEIRLAGGMHPLIGTPGNLTGAVPEKDIGIEDTTEQWRI